jgi:hypothetical protein
MKTLKQSLSLFVAGALTSLSLATFASSWYYNQNGGFGIRQPDGWSVTESGRSARLTGPETDVEQSEIFMGSDWKSSVKTLADLKTWLNRTYPGVQTKPIRISKLDGYRIGNDLDGAYFILRAPENVIVMEFHLRGSEAQIDEGTSCVSSFDIRTRETRPN